MIGTKTKNHYNENEAAQYLGVSVPQLRELIKTHVVKSEEELNNVGQAVFQPSDLLLLRFLVAQPATVPAAPETADQVW